MLSEALIENIALGFDFGHSTGALDFARAVESAARREAHDDFWMRTVTTAYEQGYGYGLEERGAERNPYATECPGHRAWAIGYETGAERRVAELERVASIRREALEEAARHILSGGYMSPDACAKAIRAMMETPQGVSTQPAPSEPHHIPDATKMVSDALPELPEPAIQVANYTGGLFGYTAEQMHTHYRKGWSDALAQSADARDAARYRWLREQNKPDNKWFVGIDDDDGGLWVGADLDYAIDAVMQGKREINV